MQTPEEHKDENPVEETNSIARDYTKYAGMAIKMGVIIAVFVIGGQWLDKKFEFNDTPVMTVVLSLLGVGLALYTTLKDLIKS